MPRNAQEWLNEKYKTNKDGVTKLHIDKEDLKGELDLPTKFLVPREGCRW